MKPVVSAVEISVGQQRWKRHADGSWSTLMFGSFPHQTAPGLIWRWVAVPTDKVPEEIKKAAK